MKHNSKYEKAKRKDAFLLAYVLIKKMVQPNKQWF